MGIRDILTPTIFIGQRHKVLENRFISKVIIKLVMITGNVKTAMSLYNLYILKVLCCGSDVKTLIPTAVYAKLKYAEFFALNSV